MRSYIFMWISSSLIWDTMSSEISDLYQCEAEVARLGHSMFEKEDVYVWYCSKGEQRQSKKTGSEMINLMCK